MDYKAIDPTRQVPNILKAQKRWLTWRIGQAHNGRPTKRPDISTLDLTQFRTWDQVKDIPSGTDAGIGFVFTGGVQVGEAHLIGIDLDGCRDPVTGQIATWALSVIEGLKQTATEVSPSGTGLHVFVAVRKLPEVATRKVSVMDGDEVPNTGGKARELQLFVDSGYMTISRQWLTECGPQVALLDDLDWLCNRFGMQQEPGGAGALEMPVGEQPLPDLSQVGTRVMRARHGPDMIEGHWQKVAPKKSASEVYHALVLLVLAACKGDGELAVEFLLECTAWGKGNIEESRDPMKYTKDKWVRREVMRAAKKRKKAEDVFVSLACDREVFLTGAAALRADVLAVPMSADVLAPVGLKWVREKPPKREFLLRRKNATGRLHGAGFMPRGIAAILSSEGGVGKTTAMLQLAISLITGKDWLHFAVDPAARGQSVLLLLAEETEAEGWRRVHAACANYQLTPDEEELVGRQLCVLAMAGKACGLAALAADGTPYLTEHFEELERKIIATAAVRGPWSLLGLDPLARMFPEAEGSNPLATFAVQALERLTQAAGNPTVLQSHHSSKMSRRANSVDARGVTGLTDAARLTMTLRNLSEGQVEFCEGKANYAAGSNEPIVLSKGADGFLRVLTEGEAQAAKAEEKVVDLKKVESDAMLVIEAIRAAPGKFVGSLGTIGKRSGIRKVDTGHAVSWAIDLGYVEHAADVPGGRKVYRVTSIAPSFSPREPVDPSVESMLS